MVVMIQMLILIILFLLSKTQSYMSPLKLNQQETTKNYLNFLAKDLKDQSIEINIKQKVRIIIVRMNIDIFSNQTFLESINFLCQFIQIKMPKLKDLKPEDITYQNTLSKITILSSLGKNFRINQLILT